MNSKKITKKGFILSLVILILGILTLVAFFKLNVTALAEIVIGKRSHYSPVHEEQIQFIKSQIFNIGIFLVVISIAILLWGGKIISIFKEGLKSQAQVKKPYLYLFWVSFIALYFEVIFIRWISTEVRVLAFFKNIPLIAAFLGLGIGCLLGRHKIRLEILFPALLSSLIIFISFGSDTYLRFISSAGATIGIREFIVWGHLMNSSLYVLASIIFYGGITFLFIALAAVMIPLGQLVGRGFIGLERIKAYSVNIAGSLAGIYIYYILAKLNTGPLLWLSIGAAALLITMFDRKKEILLSLAFTVLAFIILSHTMFPRIWSPYNRLTVTDSYLWKNPDGIGSILPQKKGEWIKIGKRIDVCDLFYMDITDFPGVTKKYPKFFGSIETYEYNLPYVILKPEKVLIVGSGGGNDVAAALRYGVKKIDAVEIDPVIAEIGEKYHPERPYDSEKVKLYINDARYFFNTTKEKYDLIVFGFLDSHSLFSTHSSVRLDNYVYTLEAFKQVKSLLEPNGSVAVSFAFAKEWMIDRFDYILEEVFGTRPQIIAGHRTLLIGGLRNDYEELIHSSHVKVSKLERKREKVPISTDDWPFLYQYKKKLPSTYLWALLIMATVSVLWVHNIIPRENLKREAHFFWLGAAFLLIEIKNISQLALLWGSTWVVNAVVLGLIMILILGANCIVHFLKVKKMEVIYLFLFISILISYFLPLNIFIKHGLIIGKTLPALIYLFPIFFAGIIFAASFKNCDTAQGALGLNLIGGVLGGFLEYGSVVIGFKNLALIALFLYGISWLELRKSEHAQTLK